MTKRKRQRRRKKEWPFPLKLLFTGGVVVLSAYLSVLLLIKVATPYRLGYQIGGDIRRMESDIRTQKRENTALKARIAVSRSNEGMEKAAREKGFAREGEQVFQFAPPEMRSALPPATVAPALRPQNAPPTKETAPHDR